MPLTRYLIRNEYSLADPELYRAADKDDPEALLEGVAMAGLVGVLRQLGDLAEFAAEIFHSLHEEVMATAARGHGLTLRVQQLEIEFPSIENNFLSQTSHSLFIQNSGVDWHSNIRLDQSLITQGELPRFVMDSYEECRGPPRLFLLDKFDVAGAGACLKRYTDPSFFKAEFSTSEAAKEELKPDNKYRKFKKKGSRWRTGDNPEVTASHFKLHQLLLEERCESQNNVQHMHLVKLKRRHSSNSLVGPTSGKSYMEKILNSHSPDMRSVRGSSAIPSHLTVETNNIGGVVLESEIHENGSVDHLIKRDKNPPISMSNNEKVLKASLDEFLPDDVEEINPKKLLTSVSEIELESITSPFHELDDNKELVVPAKDNTGASAKEYHSDDNSEIENYTDALTTMDSEMETDTESKPKNVRKFKIERKSVNSETHKEPKESQALFLDSGSIASEDSNDSIEKGKLSPSYSDTISNSAESVPSDGDLAAKVHPSAGPLYANTSSKESSEIRNSSITESSECMVNGSFKEVSEIVRRPSSDFDAITFDVVDSVTGKLCQNSRNDGNADYDISSTSNFSDTHSQSRPDLLSVESQERQTAVVSNIGNLDAPGYTRVDLTNILRPTPEEKSVDDDTEEPLSPGIADESHRSQMTGKLDSPDSVLLNTETELYDLAEKDLETRSDTRSAFEFRSDTRSASEFGHGPSTDGDVNEDSRPDTHVLVEQNDPEMSYQDVSLEFKVAEIGIGDFEVDNRQESCMTNLSGSDIGTLPNNVEPNMLDDEVKDGHEPGNTHCEPSVIMRNGDATDELPFEYTLSDSTESVPAADTAFVLANSEDVDSSVLQQIPVDSINWEVIQNAVAISVSSITGNIEAHDSLKTECGQTHLNQSNDTEVPSSTKENDPIEVRKQGDLHTEGDFLEEHEKYDAREDHWWLLQQNTESTKSPNYVVSNGASIAPSESFPMEHLSKPVDLEPSPISSHKHERSEPSQFSLQSMSQGTDLHPRASSDQLLGSQPHVALLDIILSDNDDAMVKEPPPLPPLPPMEWRLGKSPTSKGQFTLPSFSALSAETAIDIPSFSQHPTTEGPSFLEVQQTFHPISEPTATNPFLTLTDEEPEHDSSNSGEDSLKPWFTEASTCEDLNSRCGATTSVERPSSTLSSDVEDEEHSLPMEGELKWNSKSIAPIKDDKVEYMTGVDPKESSTASLIIEDEEHAVTMEGELQWESKSLGPIKDGTGVHPKESEDEEDGHYSPPTPKGEFKWKSNTEEESSLDSEIRTWQPEASTTVGLEGELRWHSNSNTMLPVVEYGKANGSLKSRPRTPLIEAVASHDKRNLRKVTERTGPGPGPQLDERNSLLEQIRAKSFNLKPAVATRPSVHGPKTNLKVVAILEKANAIRQALAGSDEEDSWSDS